MKTKTAENLVLLGGATGIFVLGARLVRLLAFSAYSLGKMMRTGKIDIYRRMD